jgi:hypothetical protein
VMAALGARMGVYRAAFGGQHILPAPLPVGVGYLRSSAYGRYTAP